MPTPTRPFGCMSALPYDAIVIGAGAAGLMCAGQAGQRGLRVALVDHSERLAEKIRISGGGRCNFTNLHTKPANFLSQNPHFCKSALAAYTPQDFLELMRKHRIPHHEKHKGQLFCDRSAEDIIAMLVAECEAGQVQSHRPCTVDAVEFCAGVYTLHTNREVLQAPRLVIATGGLSIPKIGATDFGYRIARQFGLGIVPTYPALVPLTFDSHTWAAFVGLAGVALPVGIESAGASFDEDLLFTHRGLSGPAILQISSFWRPGLSLTIDLAPALDLAQTLLDAKNTSKSQLNTVLGEYLPRRVADTWLERQHPGMGSRKCAELGNKDLQALAAGLQRWSVLPQGTEGYRKAEVTGGGVDTRALNGKTMEALQQPGLYFIGEVVDVTGWLGGYNFQWAWASGAAAARSM
jgi:predicted Rossmann fold flavoprotein